MDDRTGKGPLRGRADRAASAAADAPGVGANTGAVCDVSARDGGGLVDGIGGARAIHARAVDDLTAGSRAIHAPAYDPPTGARAIHAHALDDLVAGAGAAAGRSAAGVLGAGALDGDPGAAAALDPRRRARGAVRACGADDDRPCASSAAGPAGQGHSA